LSPTDREIRGFERLELPRRRYYGRVTRARVRRIPQAMPRYCRYEHGDRDGEGNVVYDRKEIAARRTRSALRRVAESPRPTKQSVPAHGRGEIVQARCHRPDVRTSLRARPTLLYSPYLRRWSAFHGSALLQSCNIVLSRDRAQAMVIGTHRHPGSPRRIIHPWTASMTARTSRRKSPAAYR
jgi:hypothetical protein